MDFSELDTRKGAETGFELTLRHPVTGEQLPATITVQGADSQAWEDAQAEQRRGFTRLLAKDPKRSMGPAELKAAQIELLVAVTIAWTGIHLDGEALACNPPNVRRFYTRFPWVVEQVDAAVSDRANFLPASPTN